MLGERHLKHATTVQPSSPGGLVAWDKVQCSLKGRTRRSPVEDMPHFQGQTPALCLSCPDSQGQWDALRALEKKRPSNSKTSILKHLSADLIRFVQNRTIIVPMKKGCRTKRSFSDLKISYLLQIVLLCLHV